MGNRCCPCLLNRSNKSRGPLEPIVSHSISERLQIDLFDMRHLPDHQRKWILHIVGHFSKPSALCARGGRGRAEGGVEVGREGGGQGQVGGGEGWRVAAGVGGGDEQGSVPAPVG